MKFFLFFLLTVLQVHSNTKELTLPVQMRIALNQIHSMECDFQQEREVSVLTEKGISRGKLYYIKDQVLLWQYNMPDHSGFLMQKEKITILDRTGNAIPDSGPGGLFGNIGRIILMGMSGDLMEKSEDFVPSYVDSEEYIHIRLTPVQRELRRLFTGLDLFFSKENYMIQTVVVHEAYGDKTTVRLGNYRINKPLDSSLFKK